jgi:hypothetical protein
VVRGGREKKIRRPYVDALTSPPAGEVRDAQGSVLGSEPDRVQCGRVALHQRSMPCWQAFVDHKVLVYWVAAILLDRP